ncbi:hypothetical protein H8959_001846 [Pygathrix nigripes]
MTSHFLPQRFLSNTLLQRNSIKHSFAEKHHRTLSFSSTYSLSPFLCLTCQKVKALREKAWSRTNEGNATSQSLVLYEASKENSESCHESKMTNTEGSLSGMSKAKEGSPLLPTPLPHPSLNTPGVLGDCQVMVKQLLTVYLK